MDKPHIVPVTDPALIASIERNGLRDVIGGKDASGYWAYSISVERYRASRMDQDSQV